MSYNLNKYEFNTWSVQKIQDIKARISVWIYHIFTVIIYLEQIIRNTHDFNITHHTLEISKFSLFFFVVC